jgi:glycosyltransferase involved in cell wall biosynthesis
MPSLSVLMTTYNEEKYVYQAIRSVLNQSFKDFELIIVDDGSEDDTVTVVKTFDDKRIKLFNKSHSGAGESSNYGISKCNSEIIARMDANDISLPSRLAVQLNFLNNNKDYGLISCNYAVFKDQKIIYIGELPEDNETISKGLFVHGYICNSGSMLIKDLVIKSGGYGTGLFEDYELWMKLSSITKFYNIQEVLLLVRYLENSLTHLNFNTKRITHYNLQGKYYPLLLSNISIDKIQLAEKKGWREYFWGEKAKARYYWNKNVLFNNTKIVIPYILSFFSRPILNRLTLYRMKFRLKYLLKYAEYKQLRKYLDNAIKVN